MKTSRSKVNFPICFPSSNSSIWILERREGELNEELHNPAGKLIGIEMDTENACITGENGDEEEEKGEAKQVMVLLVGAPGSGKSTFCENLINSSSRAWVRVCQDTVNSGKAGTRLQCLKSAANALKEGKSVLIDRCNLDREQRADFLKLGVPKVELHAVVFDFSAQLCISRSVKRTGHDGNLQGGKAAAVVNRMVENKELPKLTEGFSRVTFCQTDSDVLSALNTYRSLGPVDTLTRGCFGQKKDTKVQLGIMKFLKKVEVPTSVESNILQDGAASHVNEKQEHSANKQKNDSSTLATSCSEVKQIEARSRGDVNLGSFDIPTLAFPSISTADFQFDLEKASEIIAEKVEEFIEKIGNARLVLVDLSHRSKILSLVRDKTARRNIDPKKFLTFVGDITKLHSEGGLLCNVIANAANWRLKPGGGGVNAAIFRAAGAEFEAATRERAKSVAPGKAVVVPLPSACPLFDREGITHVIHVLGPNMNPQRPDCLDNKYTEGCKILREAYTSLFEGFLSIVRSQGKLLKRSSASIKLEPDVMRNKSDATVISYFTEQKIYKDVCDGTDGNKRCRGSAQEAESNICETSHFVARGAKSGNGKAGSTASKAWGSWAQALYLIATHPERHKNVLLEQSDDVVVINDVYPKAKRHLLVLARHEGIDQLADVRKEHLQLLKKMHAIGLNCVQKFLQEDASLVFRLGYHSDPSMRQLHLHVISQDFDSKHLKNKKHWNSFNTAFFRDSVDVIEEVSHNGRATLEDAAVLSAELRCNRCRSAHPNIPKLKSHIGNCQAAFPTELQLNGRLLMATNKPS